MIKCIIDSISGLLRDNVITMLGRLCDAIKIVFEYLNKVHDKKQADSVLEKKENADAKIRNACDSGTLNDLMDALHEKNAICALIGLTLIGLICGCTTIEIYTVRPWEGRYETPESAANAIRNIQLENKESIWVLSNETLKRTLITNKEK